MDDFMVIVAGSRCFSNAELLNVKLDGVLRRVKITHNVVIVSGGAKGADQLGERYARHRGYEIMRFPITQDDWRKNGKKAGYLRNVKMAKIAHACMVFWDGQSPGSRLMIRIATEQKIPLRVVMV